MSNKANLISSYDELFKSFPATMIVSDHQAIAGLSSTNPRLLRQNLFFRSNYWHCVMIIQADVNEARGVTCDVRGALGAARMALASFLEFWDFLRVDASVWWVFQHRAFEEAVRLTHSILQVIENISCNFGNISIDSSTDMLR
jgi:hypothetical protein